MKSEVYTQQNRVKLVFGGRDYFSLLHELVNKAVHVIYLQYYIFDDDETGRAVKKALINAATRGVRVYLQVDGYASKNLPRQFIEDLQKGGVYFKRFEPLFRSRKFYLGRRLHHKVVVVDGIYSLVGGINISDKYNDMPGDPAWADMALYCEGEASSQLHELCKAMWGKAGRQLTDPVIPRRFYEQINPAEGHAVRVRRNDWVKRKNEVTRSYLYMLLHAKQEIIIMCSYFLPGRVFRREFRNAIKRGVRIKVILAGPSDVMVAKQAERYLYDWMLRNGIGIYEYQKTILHAKMAVCDASLLTVGSYNVNNISAYASLELNMDVKEPVVAAGAKQMLERIIEQDCNPITRENYTSSRNLFRRFWQRACYGFVNTVFSLFTFYFRQEE